MFKFSSLNSFNYHKNPTPGKINIENSKLLNNFNYFSIINIGGVVPIIKNIFKDSFFSYKYTIKKNLVGVISNGSYVKGLGKVGALAVKPILESKVCLLKKFANINSYDIEINQYNLKILSNIIKNIEFTFSAIDLENINSDNSILLEKLLSKKLNIPVFYNDRHSLPIVIISLIINYIKLTRKDNRFIKIVCAGANVPMLSLISILWKLDFRKKNIFTFDKNGLLCFYRNDLSKLKLRFSLNMENNPLNKFSPKFNIFIGNHKGRILKSKVIDIMYKDSLIIALSDPEPEILPEVISFIREDFFLATGKLDYNNQVSGLLCYPYIFRVFLDFLIKKINNVTKVKCIYTLASLARNSYLEYIYLIRNYKIKDFDKDYILPSIMDVRLIVRIPFIIAKYSLKLGLTNFFYKNLFFYIKKLGLINLR